MRFEPVAPVQVRNVANWARVFSTLVLFERKTGGITCTCINSMLILKRINNYSCDIIEVSTTKLGTDLALFTFLRFTKKKEKRKKERTDTAVSKYLAERPLLHSGLEQSSILLAIIYWATLGSSSLARSFPIENKWSRQRANLEICLHLVQKVRMSEDLPPHSFYLIFHQFHQDLILFAT